MSTKDVNLFLGRFQPFTKGHQSVLEKLYKENGYPTVVACISNKKYDKKHPFSDELLAKEFDLCLKGKPFFEKQIYVSSAAIDKVGEELAKLGYVAHLWGCGSDRASAFEKMASTEKYVKDFPEDFKIFVVDRDESSKDLDGISATKVREALSKGDKSEFNRMMLDKAEKLYDEFKSELSSIKESFCTLKDYINNRLY